MAGENAKLVRRGYEAFNTADIDMLMRLFDERASWRTPGRSPIAGHHQGREAIFAQFGRYGGDTAGSFKADLLHVAESPDGRVVGIHRTTGARKGKSLDVLGCTEFELADGRIIGGREHFYDLYAWDDFWS